MFRNTGKMKAFSKAVPSEQFYEEMIRNAALYNKKIAYETRMRLPFLDSQTGVAQRHTDLYKPYQSRQPGTRSGQLYSYPAKRWKKKKNHSLNDIQDAKPSEAESKDSGLNKAEVHPVSTVEASSAVRSDESHRMVQQYQYYYEDWDNVSEPLDAGEIEHRESDSSDFEDTYIKKKRRKKQAGGRPRGGGGGSRGKKKGEIKERKEPVVPSSFEQKTSYDEEQEKPYSCDICLTRYKTKPGVVYHMTHHHLDVTTTAVDDFEGGASLKAPPPLLQPMDSNVLASISKEGLEHGKYCDFCLGDAKNNKKTGQSEELVSCADCGRSGHPSCLQFTANMIISVKKYPWQCIECKSCGLCGTSENDDQLLFCDDCDRGFHMYCLKPPLSQPPEGNWSCHLCIIEFYNGKKPEGME